MWLQKSHKRFLVGVRLNLRSNLIHKIQLFIVQLVLLKICHLKRQPRPILESPIKSLPRVRLSMEYFHQLLSGARYNGFLQAAWSRAEPALV